MGGRWKYAISIDGHLEKLDTKGEERGRATAGYQVGGWWGAAGRTGEAGLIQDGSQVCQQIRRIQRERGVSLKGERSKSLRRHRLRARVGGPMGREAELQQGEGKLIRPPGGLYFLEEGSEVV